MAEQMEEEDVLTEIRKQATEYLRLKEQIDGLEALSDTLRATIKENLSGMLTCPGSVDLDGIVITLVKGRESERFTRESLVKAGVLPEQIARAAVKTVGEPSLRIARKGEK